MAGTVSLAFEGVDRSAMSNETERCIIRRPPFAPAISLQGSSMENDEDLKNLLETAKTIAVLGIKEGENQDAFRVPHYMQQAGYRILPVNPKLDRVLGEPCFASLDQVEAGGDDIDIVSLFRASENVPGHVDEILALDPLPRAVWMQLGIHHGPSAQRLREAGILVIQDRCIMVEHRRLLGADA